MLHVQSFRHGKKEDLTWFGTLKINIFEAFGCGVWRFKFKKREIIADLDASRRDLLRSFKKKKLVACSYSTTLQAEILDIRYT